MSTTYTYRFDALDGFTKPLRKMAASVKGMVRPVEGVKSALGSVKPVLESVDRKADNTLGTWQKKFSQRGNGGMFSGLKSSIGGIGATIAGAFAVSEVITFGKEVTNTLAEFEKSEAVLTNLFGDGSVAKTVLKDITNFAAKTPHQVDELTQSYVKLANQGFAPNMRQMMQLSDLASSTGKDFDQLSEAILDAQTGEFERLKEFGIRSEKSGDKVAFTFKGVKKEVDFTADSIQQYLLGLGNLKGVQGASNAIMATTGGKLSNLTDKITAFKLELGKELQPIIHKVIDFLGRFVKRMSDLVAWVSFNKDEFVRLKNKIYDFGYTAFQTLSSLGKSILQATVFVFSLRAAFMTLQTIPVIIASITAAYGFLTSGMVMMNAALLVARIIGMVSPFGWIIVVVGLVVLLAKKWQWFGDLIGTVFDKVSGIFKGFFDWIIGKFQAVSEWFGSLFDFKDIPVSFDVEEPEEPSFYDRVSGLIGGDKENETSGDKNGKSENISLGLSEVKGGGGNVKHISIRIDKLVEAFNIHTSNLGMTKSQVKDEMTKVLLSVVNDVNYQ